MKDLKGLNGVKILTKNEQKQILGGLACRHGDNWCPPGSYCCLKEEFYLLCRVNGQICY